MAIAQEIGNLAPDEVAQARAVDVMLTWFANSSAPAGAAGLHTPWKRVQEWVTDPESRRSRAELKELRAASTKGALRTGAIELVYGVLALHEAGTVSVQQAAERLGGAGVQALIWTQPGHRTDSPRWAVLAPFKGFVEPEEYLGLAEALNGALGGALGSTSRNPGLCATLGRLAEDFYEAKESEGVALDILVHKLGQRVKRLALPATADAPPMEVEPAAPTAAELTTPPATPEPAPTASGATVWGAAPGDWSHFAEHLGLQADLLPVVSNPHSQVSPDSKLKAVGKVPSRYDSQHQVVGIAGWTQRQTTAANVAAWSKNTDYGICVQTRLVRAIDIDVDHPQALEIAAAVEEFLLVELPARRRGNSHKLLLALRCPGEMPKRRFPTEHGVVELLANGQQFIAVGTHPSGARYEWDGGLPADIPEVTPELLDQLWRMLIERFGTDAGEERASKGVEGPRRDTELDDVGSYLVATGRVLGDAPGKLYVACPREHEHTADSGITQAAWMLTGNGYERGHFNCQHAHAGHPPDDQEFLDSVGFIASQFEDLGPIEDEPEVPVDPARAAKFAILSVDEFLQRPRPDWLVKHVLPQAGVGVIYGAPASGKTFVTLDLVTAISRGVPDWRGNRVRQGRVVYVVAEGAGGFRNRVEAFRVTHGDLGAFSIIDAAPNLLNSDDPRALTAVIGQADVIVIDTLAQSMPGGDENTGKDMGAVLARCLAIHRRTGALVLLVHHSGKDPSKGSRGWSGIKGNVDVELQVVREGEQRALVVGKQKDGEDGLTFGFELQQIKLGVDKDGDPVTSCVVVEATFDVVKSEEGRKPGKWQAYAIAAWNALGEDDTAPRVYEELLARGVELAADDPNARSGGRDVRKQRIEGAISSWFRVDGDLVHLD